MVSVFDRKSPNGTVLTVSKDSQPRQRGLRSDCADTQADLSLRWEHMSEGTFSRGKNTGFEDCIAEWSLFTEHIHISRGLVKEEYLVIIMR